MTYMYVCIVRHDQDMNNSHVHAQVAPFVQIGEEVKDDNSDYGPRSQSLKTHNIFQLRVKMFNNRDENMSTTSRFRMPLPTMRDLSHLF